MDAIVQFINTCGFPIACAAAMFWHMTTVEKDMLEAINNNTLTISNLLNHLEKGDKDNGFNEK